MAVTYVQGRNPYGTAGSLLSVAGTVIPGAQFLVPLGLGMSAVADGGVGTGGSISSNSVLGGIMSDILKNGWKNPASGSLGKVQSSSDEELARKWGRYR